MQPQYFQQNPQQLHEYPYDLNLWKQNSKITVTGNDRVFFVPRRFGIVGVFVTERMVIKFLHDATAINASSLVSPAHQQAAQIAQAETVMEFKQRQEEFFDKYTEVYTEGKLLVQNGNATDQELDDYVAKANELNSMIIALTGNPQEHA